MRKIVLSILLSALMIVSLSAVVNAEEIVTAKLTYYISRGQLGHSSQEHSIVTPKGGDTLSFGTKQTLVVKTGSGIKKVEVKIDGPVSVGWTDITYTKVGYYFYLKGEVPPSAGEYTITARERYLLRTVTSSIKVTVVETIPVQYELFIEIDYMAEHEPTPEVLTYLTDYYSLRGISVTISVDDLVEDSTPGTKVTDEDFWAIEKEYNDGNDRAQDGVDADGKRGDKEFFLKEKWFLYGTAVEGKPNAVGYAYVAMQDSDILAGNYAFIADETADSWSQTQGLEPRGAEAVVTLHEFGHSIGIGKVNWLRIEVYDPDRRSVMSTLSVNNAKWYDWWYYSADYWATKNLGYYVI